MPASINEGCASMVVERAYTFHPSLWGQRPGGATGTLITFLSSARHGNGRQAAGWPGNATVGKRPMPARRLVDMDTDVLDVDTARRRIVDLTDAVRSFCANRKDGLCNVFVPHATAGVAIIETGAGSDDDLIDTLERLLPRDDRYRHSHGSYGHGADHVLPALVSPSVTVPVQGGEPLLGTWQSVVLVDLNPDNSQRSVRLSFVGS
jgi:secondary thiamine-phosphate synthase enzyme